MDFMLTRKYVWNVGYMKKNFEDLDLKIKNKIKEKCEKSDDCLDKNNDDDLIKCWFYCDYGQRPS